MYKIDLDVSRKSLVELKTPIQLLQTGSVEVMHLIMIDFHIFPSLVQSLTYVAQENSLGTYQIFEVNSLEWLEKG